VEITRSGLAPREGIDGDIVHVSSRALLLGLQTVEDGLEASFEIEDSLGLVDVEVHRVPVMCSDLHGGALEPSAASGDEVRAVPIAGGTLRVAIGDRIDVYSQRGVGESVSVAVVTDGVVPFYQIEAGGEWARVEWRWTDGASIRGWVRAAELREPTAEEDARARCATGDCSDWPDEGYGLGGLGLRGTGVGRGTGGDVYVGPARIQPGTQVYSGVGRAPWATVVETDGYHVLWHRGSERVEIQRAPHLSIRYPGRAYVDRSKVELLADEESQPDSTAP
jgi:hypothetical protein